MRALLCALSLALASVAAVAALPAVDGDLRLRPFTSETFGNSRVLRVLLPSGYDLPANRNRRYPVLYLNDGQNLFDTGTSTFTGREWRVDETVKELVAAGRIPPLIVVGVDHGVRTRLVQRNVRNSSCLGRTAVSSCSPDSPCTP